MKRENKKHVLMFSGGPDSLIAYHKWKDYHPLLVYCDFGHRYAEQEKEAIERIGVPCQIDDSFKRYGARFEKPDAEIPFRNLLLAISGIMHGGNIIGIVCQKGERRIPDRSFYFFRVGTRFCSFLAKREVKFDPVFSAFTKTQMVRWYLEHGGDRSLLLRTISCYNPVSSARHCGMCKACFRRWVAFSLNGLDTDFVSPPWKNEELIREIKQNLKRGIYGKQRSHEIVRALASVGVCV